jgi:hypothetical protein
MARIILMNLSLLRAGYPLTVMPNARRAQYRETLVYGQSHAAAAGPFTVLVSEACCESFVEYLRLLSTAAKSRGRGEAFCRAALQL